LWALLDPAETLPISAVDGGVPAKIDAHAAQALLRSSLITRDVRVSPGRRTAKFPLAAPETDIISGILLGMHCCPESPTLGDFRRLMSDWYAVACSSELSPGRTASGKGAGR